MVRTTLTAAEEANRMNAIRRFTSSIRRRLLKRGIPYVVTITEFDSSGVRFQMKSPTEYFRVISHGGETEYLTAMLGDLCRDDVLFDIGANIGMVSLHAAKICQTVAFEPDPSFRSRLSVNMGLNPGRAFALEPIAVSDTDSTVQLFTDGADGNSPSLVRTDEGQSVTVPARSLDSLMAEGRLPQPTVIKLDIEGAEILALRGAKRLLTGPNRPRALFIEVHDTYLPGFGSSADEVHALLHEYGYTDDVYRTKRYDQTHLILHRTAN
jgi:FkbM family methyltransferase